jgi:beta-lactamase-like protein
VTEPAALIDEYLKHRADRERQIVAALRGGHRTLQAIVEEVYGSVAEPLVRAARDSVHAHLIKLAAEGRAQEMRDGWDLT